MFKTILTLCRGATHAAEQEFIDKNAHLLLQQQMRDAGREVAAARQSVAVAIAQNRQEQAQHEKLLSAPGRTGKPHAGGHRARQAGPGA